MLTAGLLLLCLAAAAAVPVHVRQHDAPVYDAGFIPISPANGTEMFYWFFEAKQSAPRNAPVVVWLQGGPGCASAMGIFREQGPLRVSAEPPYTVSHNEYAWTSFANLLYFDSPIGSGFSRSTTGRGLRTTTDEIAQDLDVALTHFFTVIHPELASRPVHIFGESFSGLVVPRLAALVHARGSASAYQVHSMGIGNGLVAPAEQSQCFGAFGYETGLIDSVQRAELEAMQVQLASAVAKGDFGTGSALFDNITWAMMVDSGIPNPSDIRLYGFSSLNYTNVIDFVNSPAMREALHVGTSNFSSICADAPAEMLANATMVESMHLIKPLLAANIPLLFFSGNFDMTVPTPCSLEAFTQMAGSSFLNAKRTVWKVDGQTAGYIKSSNGLTFATVVQAGHMACADQPRRMQDLVQKFLANELNNA